MYLMIPARMNLAIGIAATGRGGCIIGWPVKCQERVCFGKRFLIPFAHVYWAWGQGFGSALFNVVMRLLAEADLSAYRTPEPEFSGSSCM